MAPRSCVFRGRSRRLDCGWSSSGETNEPAYYGRRGLLVGGNRNSRELFARVTVRGTQPINAERPRSIPSHLHLLLSASGKSVLFGSGGFTAWEQQLRECAIEMATFELQRTEPQLSAATVTTPSQRRTFLILLAAIVFLIVLWPYAAGLAFIGLLAAGYLANAVFRGWLFWVGAGNPQTHARTTIVDQEHSLPIYTVLVPLFREANVLPRLADSLRALEYPRASLDIKLVLEEDDQKTIDAALQASADGFFDVITVPRGKPQTKPRACTYALQFARGEYLVIFDAEDRPESDQLKKAVAQFRSGPKEVACLQARLNFFNARECWLTRMFTLDYALWFDFLLPGLDYLGIPMPLGGTSNHFRISALRAIHGWDPFNVTEDADIGIRLARHGLRVQTLDSTTFEEATNSLPNWLRQRTRWLKGYMQTWLVHMRSPRALLRNAGVAGFFGFQLFVGGTVLSALLNPLLWSIFILSYFITLPLPGFSGDAHTLSAFGLLVTAFLPIWRCSGPIAGVGWIFLRSHSQCRSTGC